MVTAHFSYIQTRVSFHMHRAESTLELWVLGWSLLHVAIWRLAFGGSSWIFDKFLIPCLNTNEKYENVVLNMSEDIKNRPLWKTEACLGE